VFSHLSKFRSTAVEPHFPPDPSLEENLKFLAVLAYSHSDLFEGKPGFNRNYPIRSDVLD
jgi:hypothetical protein